MKTSLGDSVSQWKKGRFETLSRICSGLRRKKYDMDKEAEAEAQQYERLPSWQELGVEFVNRTTWHGLKYISIPSRFLLRRIIWIAILLSNAVLFIYIMTTRKDYMMTHPTTITVEVSYKDVLPFSAITICNHNPYRLTAMQELGLYDLLVNDLDSTAADDDRECGYFERFSGICRLPDLGETDDDGRPKIVVLNETTRSVCMRVCEDAYDWYCSGVFYDRRTRSCILSPYTGEWVDPDQSPCTGDAERVEFYRRHRCAYSGEINCNFEDTACTFKNDSNQNDKWQVIEAAGHYVEVDNTLNLGSGHVANLLLTELRPGYTARYVSEYMNTTGKCLQLFYWLLVNDATTSESATLSIILITEERQKVTLLELSKGPKDWSREYITLPDGVHQVAIEGRRGFVGQSGICLDDVSIKDCKKFVENRNCKVTRGGRAYLGKVNMTATGEPCLPWESISSPLLNRLPDDNLAAAENFCRNVPQQNWSEPSCFVQLPSLAVLPMPCEVPYCECPDEVSYFKCNNGICLPRDFLCNGIDDCLDGSDEYDICNRSRSIECYFDTDYKCGYESNNVGSLRFIRLSASDLRYYYGANIISANVSALEQLMLVDSKLGQMGDQVQLVSPLWTFREDTELKITYIMMGLPQPPNSKAGLYLYQYSELHVPVRLLFSMTSFIARDLQIAKVCVPSGTYHLMFLGVQGVPYESDFAIDIVKINGECTFKEEPQEDSFDCNFMTMCGYKFISTSALFTWTLVYTNNAFMNNDDLCSAVFGGIEGVITSPGYPNNYNNSLWCNFSIVEPSGVTIEITFLEFLLEPESDCRFDRLEINDPLQNRTEVYCGDTELPPVFKSKGNVLNFLFKTDESVNNGRFKLSYKSPSMSPQGTDYAVSLKFSGDQSQRDFVHSAKLISPKVSIFSNSCVTMMLMAASNFTVKMAYLVGWSYTELLLLSSPQPLGGWWHRIYLDLSPSMSNDVPFAIVFETAAAASGVDSAIINDIGMFSDSCRNVVTNGSLECQFKDINQCGYLDVSKKSNKWLRNYDKTSDRYYMQTYFDPVQYDEVLLQSVFTEITRDKCVKVTYFSSSQDVNLRVESIPPSFLRDANVNTTSPGQLTFGNTYVQQNLPVGRYSLVLRGFLLGENNNRVAAEQLRVYHIGVVDGKCPVNETADNSLCTFDNPNLCGYVVNYRYGAPWKWVKFDNFVVGGNNSLGFGNNRDNVMMYNGSHPNPMKGIMLTSNVFKHNPELMTFEVYSTSSVSNSFIEVYSDSMWYNSFNRLTVDGDLVRGEWSNLSVCLPAGSFRVMFAATVALPGSLLAIDKVYQSEVPCSIPTSVVSDCVDPDLTDCDELHFSWSPLFAWRYTSDITNDSVIPGRDGCVHIYYETEGVIVYNRTGKQYMEPTECDHYIKGLTAFVVEIWFEEFQSMNCSAQYLEFWTVNGSEFTNGNRMWCNELKNLMNKPIVFRTDRVLQIKILVSEGYPRFRLRYKYTPDTMTGLFMALHYVDTKTSGTFTIDRVAQWASHSFVPSSGSVCLNFDVSISFSLLEVVLVESDPENKLIVPSTVLEWRSVKSDRDSWIHGAFEVPVKTDDGNRVHFVFYISTVNAAFVSNEETFVGALKNVTINNGSCVNKDSPMLSFGLCQFSKDDSCGYRDSSQNSTRWVLRSQRAKYITTGNCKVSPDGREYIGNISNTISGRRCQSWSDQLPHAHNQDVAEYFPVASLEDAANHCRNPSNPFIARSSWCYSMYPEQRREYCDIPFCLDHVLQTMMLASQASRAVLSSAPLRLNQSSCLEFRYQLTSTLVELSIKIATNASTVPDNLATFSIQSEPTSFVWKTGTVDLPSNATQIYFVADKLDISDLDQFVSIDNISVSDGPCVRAETNETVPATTRIRIPYTGPRLPRNSYINLVLEELKGKDMRVLSGIMAHQAQQLIHKCDYGQQPCNNTDFMREFTDMGQCYTFNYDPNSFREAFTTGAESGARLVLNVEQYEHVKNYVSGVGVKIYLHDQVEISSMRDLGVAAMPGVHNLATISYTNIENLPPPFGSCGVVDLPFYQYENLDVVYTEAKCRMESKTRFVEEKCHCKDIYMPGPFPVCSLAESIDCRKGVTEASLNVSSSASCPAACNSKSFGVGLSQSQLSGLDIDTLLGNRTEDLQQHYFDALEIRNRIDEDTMTDTIKNLELLLANHNELNNYIFFAVIDQATSIPKHIEAALETVSQLIVSDIVTGGGALLSQFEAAYLVNVQPRESYLRESSTSLQAKLSLSKDLFKDLKNQDDLSWYARVFNDSVSKLLEFGQTLATYDRTINYTNSYLPKTFIKPPCETYRLAIMQSIPNLVFLFRNFTSEAVSCGSCDQMIDVLDEMLMFISNFSNCNSEYGDFLTEFRQWLNAQNFDFKEFSNSINSEQVLNLFIHNKNWMLDLKTNYSQNQISKLSLAEQLLSDTSLKMSQDVDNVIQNINQQIVVPLQNKITNTEEQTVVMYLAFLKYLVRLANYTLGKEAEQYARLLKFWRKPLPNLEVPEVLEFSLSQSETWQVWPAEKSLQAFVEDNAKDRLTMVSVVYFSELNRQLSSFMSDIKNYQNPFLASIETVKNSLQAYNDTMKINDKFVMQNFLMLDIYYGEMKYEHISQSETYTWTNFFSELGSYFGLLMGCSLLTMIEVLDLVIYYSIVKMIERYQTPPRRMEVIEVNQVGVTPV